jgi:hypothetical protein
LKNHLGVPPTKFAEKQDGKVACMKRDGYFYFGTGEGFIVSGGNYAGNSGRTYEAPDLGVALFHGDEGGVFRAARWELWQVR